MILHLYLHTCHSPLSSLAEEIIMVNPVRGFHIDSAVVGVQESLIRPISQNVWQQKGNRLWSAIGNVLDHV